MRVTRPTESRRPAAPLLLERLSAGRHRRRHAVDVLFPTGSLEAVGQKHGSLPPPAPTEDQVACAIFEARAIAGAFLRLGREACPQLRWRCEGVGIALDKALAGYFRELEQ